MGKECVLYMQQYDNLPVRTIATVLCCPSCGGLSGRSLRPFACCPPWLSAQDKICPLWQRRKRKIRAAWTVCLYICNHTIICHRGSPRLLPAVCLSEGLAIVRAR